MHFSWLHLTDFHQGLGAQDWLWPGVEEEFYEDLRRLHAKCGPWDLILFTGDITQKADAQEFARFDQQLAKLREHLQTLAPGHNTLFAAVPGNHDLLRPKEDEPLLELFADWSVKPKVRDSFWGKADSPYRTFIGQAFANYQQWWTPHTQRLPHYQAGLLPGDFSATVEKDGARLGLLGLNSAFLQLAGGDYEQRLALHAQQFHAACGGDGIAWAKRHHACLLLTHHPAAWLDQESKQHLAGEILAKQRFVLHLCGHMHETNLAAISEAGGDPRRQFQARSLFGLEHIDGKLARSHGYAAGLLELKGQQGELRLWPREAKKQGHAHKLTPDHSLNLIEDGLHTPPVSVPLLAPLAEASGKAGLEVVLEVRLHELAEQRLQQAIAALQALGRSVVLRVIEVGSVRLIFEGNREDVDQIVTAYQAGRLAELAGLPVRELRQVAAPAGQADATPAALLQAAQRAYPPAPAEAGQPWDMPRLNGAGILSELAQVFSDERSALGLLELIGFPRDRLQPFSAGTPRQFWQQVCGELLRGCIVDGIDALLHAAADQYPGNAVFARGHAAVPADRAAPAAMGNGRAAPPQPHPAPAQAQPDATGRPGAELFVYGIADVHVLIDTARSVVQSHAGAGVELAFASPDMIGLHLSGVDAGTAADLRQHLQTALAAQQPQARVDLAMPGFRPYLYQRLYLEGPDQSRFELEHVPATTRVADIAKAAISQYDDALWPRDRQGLQRQAVVDHVQADGSTQRLDPDRTLHDSGVQDGDTLHMAPESTAGAINPMIREEALARVRGQVMRFAGSHADCFQVEANAQHAPTEYLCRLRAAGWGPPERDGEPPYPIEQHEVLLVLPADFPMQAPQAFWQTPIFHPNIHPKNGAVCLGALGESYRPGLDFGELCQILLDMAGFRNYEVREVYNAKARDWARSDAGQKAIAERGGNSLLRRVLGAIEQEQMPPPPLRIKRTD